MIADLTPPWENGRLGNLLDATCPIPHPEGVQMGQILPYCPDLIRGYLQKPGNLPSHLDSKRVLPQRKKIPICPLVRNLKDNHTFRG